MTNRERDQLCKAIRDAIGDDELLYDRLPGNGEDDYILSLIFKDIERVRMATKTEKET